MTRGYAVLLIGSFAAAAAASWGCAGDDPDPEPPPGPSTLKRLQGTWGQVRTVPRSEKGTGERGDVYRFKGDQLVVNPGGKDSAEYTVVPDRKRRGAFALRHNLTQEVVERYFSRIEEGELYLAVDRTDDPRAEPDFTGSGGPVFVLARVRE
jgi:hypothetical protein